MIDNKAFEQGQRLSKIRKYFHFRQDDFAELIGITRGHLSQIENGKRNISYTIINTLVEKVPSINLNHLITGGGEMISDLGAPPVNTKNETVEKRLHRLEQVFEEFFPDLKDDILI